MLPRVVPSGDWVLTNPVSSHSTVLYDPKTFFTHAALLRQSFLHCAIFPTAASRRSLGRVSVPVWLIILSDQLIIFGLVSHYPTNYLMIRGLIQGRQVRRSPPFRGVSDLCGISSPFQTLSPTQGQITHALLTRAPLYSTRRNFLVRLACVKHAASVRSECRRYVLKRSSHGPPDIPGGAFAAT